MREHFSNYMIILKLHEQFYINEYILKYENIFKDHPKSAKSWLCIWKKDSLYIKKRLSYIWKILILYLKNCTLYIFKYVHVQKNFCVTSE